MNLRELLKQGPVEASAPCRIDMGGTLDLSTFFLPLRHLNPCTFNAALDLRTSVRLFPYEAGKIKVSSVGFDSVEADSHNAPFDHKLGLMMAVAGYYNADGVHIDIQSSSPPRSALGGSSVAAVALIWAFSKVLNRQGQSMPDRSSVALLAHAIEQSVAGVACGIQDQLAAVYGGVNAWYWVSDSPAIPFKRVPVMKDDGCKAFADHLLVAYCGAPHISKNVNATWVRQFIAGRHRRKWHEITECSRLFVSALTYADYPLVIKMMNQETDLRCDLTPDVLDDVGKALVESARDQGCGARFTGAGGGGCIWAFGEPEDLALLRPIWENILTRRKPAKILNAGIDTVGLL
jgi:D-glycero-alpha-D-manno-heptose-7-phosphate kinase